MTEREKRLYDLLGKTVHVEVDRPQGTIHKGMVYPVNYGFVPGMPGGDGEEQDAYILGIHEPVETFTGKVIAIIHRRDDVEDKWVVASEGMAFSKEEIERLTYFQEQYFDSEIIF